MNDEVNAISLVHTLLVNEYPPCNFLFCIYIVFYRRSYNSSLINQTIFPPSLHRGSFQRIHKYVYFDKELEMYLFGVERTKCTLILLKICRRMTEMLELLYVAEVLVGKRYLLGLTGN